MKRQDLLQLACLAPADTVKAFEAIAEKKNCSKSELLRALVLAIVDADARGKIKSTEDKRKGAA